MLEASPLLNAARLQRVASDFGIVPEFLTNSEVSDIADSVSNDGSFPAIPIVVGRGAQSISLRSGTMSRYARGSDSAIGFAEFVEFLALSAVHALSKPQHDAQYRTTPIKVAVLLDIWGAGDTRSLELLMLRDEGSKVIDQSTTVHRGEDNVRAEGSGDGGDKEQEQHEDEDETKVSTGTTTTATATTATTVVQSTTASTQPRKKRNLFAC